ncbi:hypothetical protein Hanom_Chr01g00015361 [Helianthus anomalus]
MHSGVHNRPDLLRGKRPYGANFCGVFIYSNRISQPLAAHRLSPIARWLTLPPIAYRLSLFADRLSLIVVVFDYCVNVRFPIIVHRFSLAKLSSKTTSSLSLPKTLFKTWSNPSSLGTSHRKSVYTMLTRMTLPHGTEAIWVKLGGYAAGTSYI